MRQYNKQLNSSDNTYGINDSPDIQNTWTIICTTSTGRWYATIHLYVCVPLRERNVLDVVYINKHR